MVLPNKKLDGLGLEKREPEPKREGVGVEKIFALGSVGFEPKRELEAGGGFGASFAVSLAALSTSSSALGGAGWAERILLNSPTPCD